MARVSRSFYDEKINKSTLLVREPRDKKAAAVA